jgi:2-polyprenyl-3-methyl-5-hydroxy-6-metoxy-1,4-benzoquinol methylase
MQQTLDTEFVDLYDVNEENFWIAIEHIGRYVYARWFANKRRYENVLDIACSNGYGSNMIAKSGKNVVGVDISDDLIDIAKKSESEHLCFIVADIDRDDLAVALDDQKFGLIVSFETLEHVEKPRLMLEKLKRLMTSDGRIIISVPNGAFDPVDKSGKPKNVFHKHVFLETDLLEMFKSAGFEVEFKLGQGMINSIMRKHNGYCSRNKSLETRTTSNFKIDPQAIDYYVKMFGYPEKNDIENSYVGIYVLKHKK